MTSIPDVPPTDAAMRAFLLALKQAVQTTSSAVDTVTAAVAAGDPTDETPPAAPTVLTGGSSTGVVTLNWLNPGDTDLAHVEVWERTTDVQPNPLTNPELKIGEVVSSHGTLGSFIRTGLAVGAVRYYWVRAVDLTGNFSPFNAASGVVAVVTLGTAAGTLSAPASVAATGGFQSVWITWTNTTNVDLSSVRVYENITNNSATATVVGTVTSYSATEGNFYRSNIGTNQTRYYWLKSVDNDGLVSAFSTGVSATTGTIDPAELGTTVGFSAPTSLNVNSNLTTDTDGHQIVTVTTAWAQIADARLSFYEVAVSEAAGSYIVFPTSDITYNLRAKAATAYSVKVRGVDRNGNRTSYSTVVSITSTSKTAAPAAATGLALIIGIGSFFLSWTNPGDVDVAATDIYEGSGGAFTMIATVNATPGQPGRFARVGLPTNTLRYYYVVARDRSGNISAASATVSSTTAKVLSGDIAVDSVLANSVVSNVTTTDVLNANVLQSSTSLPASLLISGTGFSLTTVAAVTANPAAYVNSGATLINPGQVLISGASTLSSWRDGTDATKITGGKIAADTVAVNSLQIGARGIEVTGITFEFNTIDQGTGSVNTNYVAWSFGTILYNGITTPINVAAGFTSWAGSTVYIYWTKGSTSLSSTTTPATAYGANNIVLATYSGGALLVVTYGGTTIDGPNIKTGTIGAAKIVAGSLTANEIATGAITTVKLDALAVTAAKIATYSIDTTRLAINGVELQNMAIGAVAKIGTNSASPGTDMSVETTIATLPFTNVGGQALIDMAGYWVNTVAGNNAVRFRCYLDSTLVFDDNRASLGGFSDSRFMRQILGLTAGYNVFKLTCNTFGGLTGMTMTSGQLTITELRKAV